MSNDFKLLRLASLVPTDIFYFRDENFFKFRGVCPDADRYIFMCVATYPALNELQVKTLGKDPMTGVWEHMTFSCAGSELVYVHRDADDIFAPKEDLIGLFVLYRAKLSNEKPTDKQMKELKRLMSKENFKLLKDALDELFGGE